MNDLIKYLAMSILIFSCICFFIYVICHRFLLKKAHFVTTGTSMFGEIGYFNVENNKYKKIEAMRKSSLKYCFIFVAMGITVLLIPYIVNIVSELIVY